MERSRLGFPFARSAAAEVNYSCVRIGHAIHRRHLTKKRLITGAVQGGNSVTHSIADSTRNWSGHLDHSDRYDSRWRSIGDRAHCQSGGIEHLRAIGGGEQDHTRGSDGQTKAGLGHDRCERGLDLKRITPQVVE
jgi:hypothetical protein